jgi:hypothetical protein
MDFLDDDATPEERRAALIQALQARMGQAQPAAAMQPPAAADFYRGQGNLGMLSGDRVLGGMGQAQLGQAQQLGAMNQQAKQFGLGQALEARRAQLQQEFQGSENAKNRGAARANLLDELAARERAAREKAEAEKGEKGQKTEEGLRKEFMGMPVVKETVAMRTALKGIEAALGANTPAGDMAGIFQFMKVLDPTSSVREGEYANAKNAGGVPDQLVNLYNQALSGKLLNPAQRKDFIGRAEERYRSQLGVLNEFATGYRGLATQQGANPSRVVIGFEENAAPAGAEEAPPPGMKWQRNKKTGARRLVPAGGPDGE